jgi:hypothetical protein
MASADQLPYFAPGQRFYAAHVIYVEARLSQEGPLVPWVSIAPSTIMGSLHFSSESAAGLFAKQGFFSADVIGMYMGRVMGRTSDLNVQNESHSSTSDKIVTLTLRSGVDLVDVFVDGAYPPQLNEEQVRRTTDSQNNRPGFVVFDQAEVAKRQLWPGAYVHMANDPRGTGREANTELDDAGFFVATRYIPAGREIL